MGLPGESARVGRAGGAARGFCGTVLRGGSLGGSFGGSFGGVADTGGADVCDPPVLSLRIGGGGRLDVERPVVLTRYCFKGAGASSVAIGSPACGRR